MRFCVKEDEDICTKPFNDLKSEEFLKSLFGNHEVQFCDIFIDMEFIDQTVKILFTKNAKIHLKSRVFV